MDPRGAFYAVSASAKAAIGLIVALLGPAVLTQAPVMAGDATSPPSVLGRVKTESASDAAGTAGGPLDPTIRFSRPWRTSFLPLLAPSTIEFPRQRDVGNKTERLQVGIGRVLDQAIMVNSSTSEGHWSTLPDGRSLLSVHISSPGAIGLRLHFENVALPPGALLVIYDLANPLDPAISLDEDAFGGKGGLWAPTVFAEQARIECQIPAGSDPGAAAFSIREISHLYGGFQRKVSNPKDATCHLDAACYPDFAGAEPGVAMITYVQNGNIFLCTGCLLATAHKTSVEYFLTARHCIGSQDLAATVEFHWLFQTSQCNGAEPALGSVPVTRGGADLLAAGPSDFALLKLHRSAPAGVTYLGWSVAPPTSDETLASLHHPSTQPTRISFGNLIGSDIYFWGVQWSAGPTGPGSSGGPLLNVRQQVIGQLAGGFNGPGSACDNPAGPDKFGRFDVTYPLVKKWIDPNGIAGGPGSVPGTYYGLFNEQTLGVALDDSGSFSITTTRKGRFTGTVSIGAATHRFQGHLTANGAGDAFVKRGRQATLAMHFQIDVANGAENVAGVITDGNWTAPMTGALAVFDGKTLISPQAGRYTLIIAGRQDVGPGGNSYGTVLVNNKGRVSIHASMADGTKVNRATFLSRAGVWPLFAPLRPGNGFLFSWVQFSSTDASDLAGQFYWIKEGNDHFSLVSDLAGASYSPPNGTNSLLTFTNGLVTLRGGGLDQDFQTKISLDQNGKLISSENHSVKLNFMLSTGAFSGAVIDPASRKSLEIRGAFIQKQNLASGYFRGPNQVTGQILIQADPNGN